ncbi:GHKL domain-containing protein [bacterium 1XD42-54]|nr:GHKL domain-containing protein [bacterium 1XD42-54]
MSELLRHQDIGFILINILGQFLESFLFMYFIHSMFSPKRYDFERLWLPGTAVMLLSAIVCDAVTDNNIYAWMGSVVLVPFIYTIVFCKGDLKIKFVLIILFSAVLFALENLSVTLCHAYIGIREACYTELLLVYIFRRLFMKICLLIALKMLLQHRVKASEYLQGKSWYFLGIISVLEIWMIFCFDRKHQAFNIEIALDAFCVAVPLLLYYALNLMEDNIEKTNIAVLQRNFIDMQKEYVGQILDVDHSLKEFKHDYKAHLFCIDALIQEKDYTSLQNYLSELHKIQQKLDYGKTYMEDHILNVILNIKRTKAIKSNIAFDIWIGTCSLKEISSYDLGVILMNLCDNAIEAAEKAQEKWVKLELENRRGYIKIIIRNSTYANILQNNPDLLTDKEDGDFHGYGMKIIQNIVEQYQGVMKLNGGENWFESRILLLNDGNEADKSVNI